MESYHLSYYRQQIWWEVIALVTASSTVLWIHQWKDDELFLPFEMWPSISLLHCNTTAVVQKQHMTTSVLIWRQFNHSHLSTDVPIIPSHFCVSLAMCHCHDYPREMFFTVEIDAGILTCGQKGVEQVRNEQSTKNTEAEISVLYWSTGTVLIPLSKAVST